MPPPMAVSGKSPATQLAHPLTPPAGVLSEAEVSPQA